MKRKSILILFVVIALAAVLVFIFKDKLWTVYKGGLSQTEAVNKYDTLFANHPQYISDGFDYPVGPPNAVGYYDAQPFTKNKHLGSVGTVPVVAIPTLAMLYMQWPTGMLPTLKMQVPVGATLLG